MQSKEMISGSDRKSSPAALRNRKPIADALAGELPDQGTVLMVAEGSGEHAVHFAARFPHLTWLPSDTAPSALASIAAHRHESGLPNLRAPLKLDVSASQWPDDDIQAILCINMVHIAPWNAALDLMHGAGRILPRKGLLYLYGPFLQENVETAASNQAFNENLKARNGEWGLRSVEAVAGAAQAEGLTLQRLQPMPANNLSLFFRRA